MEMENIMLSEVSQIQKDKGFMFFLICIRRFKYKYKHYHIYIGKEERKDRE
jgi:hypothetical protein